MTSKKESQTIKVMNHIIDLIRSEQLAPGNRVKEIDIAEATGASRSTIRSAISVLIGQGVLTAASRGVSVPKLDENELREHFEFRIIVESGAVALACERAQKADISNMKKIVSLMEESVKKGALIDFIDADEEFHKLIADISGNQRIVSLLPILRLETVKLRSRSLMLPGEAQARVVEHKKILNKFIEKDKNGAMQEMITHIQNVAESLNIVITV